MEEKRSRKSLFILLGAVAGVLIIVIVLSLIFLNKNDGGYRVIALMNFTTERPSDFSKSRLNIYENGSFDIEIIYTNKNLKRDEKHFVGIGTYTKTKNAYFLTYLDVYTLTDGIPEQDERYIYSSNNQIAPFECSILKNDRIRFATLEGRFYTFGK